MSTYRALGPEQQALDDPDAQTSNLPVPKRALVVAAHPDDAEFYTAGTIAKWTQHGCDATYLVLTDGAVGAWGSETGEDLATRRADEQREAARVAGVDNVVFGHHADGFFENSLDVRRELAGWIRRLKPQVLLAHDPWKPYRLHPDHRAAGFATLDAVTVAREPLAYADMAEEAHRPDKILLFETDAANHFESIVATLDTKIEALLAHKSQYTTTMNIDGPDDRAGVERFRDRVRAWSREAGEAIGVEYAEAFKTLTP